MTEMIPFPRRRRRGESRRSGQRTWTRRALVATAAVVLTGGLAGCHVPRPWQIQLVSANAAGTDSGDNESRYPQLSQDGAKVVFESDASDLGPTDTNGNTDIYIRDLTTGTTELVSLNAAGTDSADGGSERPVLSRDGTKVAFHSNARNLTAVDPGIHTQLYVRDLATGVTTLASVNADGTGGANESVDGMTFDPSGTKILFLSHRATNVVPGSPPGYNGAFYERDLRSGVTVKIADGNGGVYSPMGDAMAFVNGDALYLRDTATGAIQLVPGVPAGRYPGRVHFSHDGSRLAFEGGEPLRPYSRDIYVYDRVARTMTLATPGVSGGGGDGPSTLWGFHPTDRDRLLFTSTASNLVTSDPNGDDGDVFVRDLGRRVTTLVTVDNTGLGWGGPYTSIAGWVGTGSKVAFVSPSERFEAADTNSLPDVYIRDMAAGTYTLVSVNGASHAAGNGRSGEYRQVPWPGGPGYPIYHLSVSADGSRIAFGSYANDLGPTDSPRSSAGIDHDAYVATLVTPS